MKFTSIYQPTIKKKSNLAKILPGMLAVLSLGAVIFIGTQSLGRKDTAPEQSSASEVNQANDIYLKVNPGKVLPGQVTSLVVRINNLTSDVDKVKIFVDSELEFEEEVEPIGNPFMIAHIMTPNQLESMKPLIDSFVINHARSLESIIERGHSQGFEQFLDINIIADSPNIEDILEKIVQTSIVDKRNRDGEEICGIAHVVYDEPLHLRRTHYSETETYEKSVEEVALLITRTNKEILDASEGEECRSITQVGFVEWKQDYIESILDKLENLRNDNTFEDREFAYVSFFQSEDYSSPWASALVESPIEDMLGLAQDHNVDFDMWVIGIEEALAFSKYTDKVIITDSWGRWGVTDDPIMALRHRENKCYEPCPFDSSVAKCCPYIANVQQELYDLYMKTYEGKDTSYNIYEKIFSDGNYEVDIKLVSANGTEIKNHSVTIPVGNDEVYCVGDCTGIECGNDGCGGSCGACIDDLVCSLSGECIPMWNFPSPFPTQVTQVPSVTQVITGTVSVSVSPETTGTQTESPTPKVSATVIPKVRKADYTGTGRVGMEDFARFKRCYIDRDVCSDLNEDGNYDRDINDWLVFIREYKEDNVV